MVKETNLANRIADTVIYIVLAILTISCLLPFIHVIALSMSDSNAVLTNSVGLAPKNFTLDNYQFVLRDDQFLRSFFISVLRVATGVIISGLLSVLTAYPLSLEYVRMPGRNLFKVLMLFGVSFSGGLISTFLAYRNLGLIDNFAVLVVPNVFNMFHIIILINFFRAIPRELSESATIDGANQMQILFKIYLPLSLPAIATVSLFTAVSFWNEWFNGVVFISQTVDRPLQTYLFSLLNTQQVDLMGNTGGISLSEITPAGIEAALILVSTLPILLVYPFLQRYFVSGLTLGAVKS